MARLTVADDASELAGRAAERITQLIGEAASTRGGAFVSLTGGSTPRTLYGGLADAGRPWRDRIPWSQLDLFWGDERHVPPDHPDSNYGMARAALLEHVPIGADHVHRMRGEMRDAREAADDYARTLVEMDAASAFRRNRNGGHYFDLMLLGVGDDAHVASIFPGSELLDHTEDSRRVAGVWVKHLEAWRITLTPSAILDSGAIVVLVSGAKKADAMHAAFAEPQDVKRYPVQILRAASDRVEWFLDRAAASRL